MLDHGREQGYLVFPHIGAVSLTFNGWQFLEDRPTSGRPDLVFVAMSFAPELERAYDLGIQPAIEVDCKMTSVRVDRVHHNEKICDRILAEIQRCRIIVADFTQQRGGVYFEAGFALALGKTVIWTCREDDVSGLHFDTRQYAHLVWRDAADLRRKLVDRIRVLVGAEMPLPQS